MRTHRLFPFHLRRALAFCLQWVFSLDLRCAFCFHLQCAVNFFYSVCSVSLCCAGVHLIFHWRGGINFIRREFDLVCGSIFLSFGLRIDYFPFICGVP